MKKSELNLAEVSINKTQETCKLGLLNTGN